MANIYSTITYNANLSPAQAQIKALTGQIAGLTAAFNTLDKSAIRAQAALASTFMTNVGQIGGFSGQMVKVNSAVNEFGQALQNQRLTMRQYFREAVAGYTKQNSLMRQLADQQVRFQQSMVLPMGAGPGGQGRAFVMTPQTMSGLAKSTELASAKFSIFNELVNGGATRLLNFGKNTQWAGRQLMIGFTLPMALFTATVSKQFRELDKELTRFQKVYGEDLGGAVGEATLRMRKQVEQLAFDIGKQYGIAANETAALAADIAATGAEGEKLIQSVQQTTRLAVLGEVDRQEAMKATLSLQSAFKMNTNELAQSINFLNAVENQTTATLQDFAVAIPKVGPVVQALGGDIEDLAALLVAMREGGIPAAEAANAIKSGLASMINPTKKASEVAAEFGINLRKIVDDNRGELMPTIFSLQDALQSLDDFGRARIIEEIFGKYQFARISALFENLGRAGSQTEAVLALTAKSSAELANIANAELRVLTESTSVKFQRALEQLRNTLIPIGETLTETLIPVFEFIGSGINKFVSFFQALPEPVKNFAKYTAAIAALAGPVVMLVGLFGNLFAQGIRIAMMIVNMGARIGGLRFEKFELLNADVVAARANVDGLTGSFNLQDAALRKLIGAMSAYGASLRTLQATNPTLFTSPVGRAPIRRAAGSMRPEFVPGSGRGDKVPALLEPGEFIVNRGAAEKFGPLLSAMNRGRAGKYQEGGLVRAHATAPGYLSLTDPRTVSSLRESSSAYAWKMIQADIAKGAGTLRVFSNLVLMLKDETNKLLNTTGVNKAALMEQIKSTQSWEFILKKTGLTMQDLQPVISSFSRNIAAVDREIINDPQMYKAMEMAISKLAQQGDKAAAALQTLSQQYGTFEVSSGRRENFGAAAYGVPGYKGSGPIATARTPLQSRQPNVNLPSLFVAGMSRGAAEATRSSSPSREAEAVGRTTGINVGTGMMNGIKRGLQQSASKPAVLDLSRITALQQMTGPGLSSPYPRRTGPTATLNDSMAESRAGRSMGTVMNAAFMGSMLVSTFSAMSGVTSEVTEKLMIFSTALMAASTAAQLFQGRNMLGNFMGLGSLGRGVAGRGAAMAGGQVATTATGRMAGMATFGAARGAMAGGQVGAGLLMGAGRALSVLGGPVGIAAGLGITAAITAFMMYRNAAEEARERAIAAFNDPVQTAEFFGETVKNVAEVIEQNKLANVVGEDLAQVDDALREAVRGDYAKLIEKISETTSISGARDLSTAFATMITSGMSAENAKAAIQAIATEAGAAGGEAFSVAMQEGMLSATTKQEAVDLMVSNLLPGRDPFSLIPQLESNLASLEQEFNATAQRFVQLEQAPVVGKGFNEYMQELGGVRQKLQDLDEEIIQTKRSLEELTQVSPDQLVQVAENLLVAYSDAPQEVSDAMNEIETMVNNSTDKQGEYFNIIRQMLKDTYSEDMAKYGGSIDTVQEATAALKLVTSGISLNRAIDSVGQFNAGMARALTRAKNLADITGQLRLQAEEEYFGMIDSFFAQERAALESQLAETEAGLEASTSDIGQRFFGNAPGQFFNGIKIREPLEAAEEALDDLRAGTQDFIRERENLIESYQEEMDIVEERYDEEVQALEDQKDQINESTDAYIQSIQKRQRADNFYANQRKTAFGALQKLAAGDVFGFLQARQDMSQSAQQFSYDSQIQSIEDRRDLEIQSIDDQIEARRVEHEKYKETMQDKIDLERDLIEQRQDALDAAERNHQRLMDNYDEQILAAKGAATKEMEEIRGKISFIEGAEEAYRKNSTEAETIYSKEYTTLKTAPYVEARKEFLKLRVEEIFYRGGTTLSDAIRQAGLLDSDLRGRSAAAEIQRFVEELNLRYGTRGRFMYGATDTYRRPEVPDTRTSTGISTDDVSISNPNAVYINGVDVSNGSSAPSGGSSSGGRSPNAGGFFAMGGYISGPGTTTSDSIPARLSNGEYVVRASSVKKYGVDMMNSINTAKFAEGGLVEGGPGTSARRQSLLGKSSIGFAGPNFITGRMLPRKERQPKPISSPTTPSQPPVDYIPPTGSYNPPSVPGIPNVMSLATKYANLPYSSAYPIPTDRNGVPTGWGCATSVAWLYKNGAGITLPSPSLSYGQYAGLRQNVSRQNIAPGDLIFYKNNGPSGVNKQNPVNHVEMYMGNGRVFNGGVGIQSGFSNHPIIGIKRPSPMKFAGGGFVSGIGGPKSDMIPAMLSNGEYVLKAGAVKKYGRGMLDQINAGNFGMKGATQPTFAMPRMSGNVSGVSNNFGGNKSNVKIIINGASGKSAAAIANKVASMINSSNNRRNHSRSI